MMTIVPRSITGRLFLWLFLGGAVVLMSAGLFLDSEVRKIVIESVDRTLHSKRQMITGLLHEEHGGIELELSDIIAGEYIIPRSGHYYRVMMDDRVLAASPSLVRDDFLFLPAGAAPGGTAPREGLYTSIGPDDEPVRVLRYQYAAFSRQFDVVLAESLVDSLSMISTFRNFLAVSIPLSLLVLCFAAWWIAKASLRPLASFSAAIEAITHRDLEKRIDGVATVRELAKLAQSFNAMLDRLNSVFMGQKRLVADASHELKTPLSIIRAQCDVALQRARTAEEYVESLKSIQSTSQSMEKLISDLLSLARLDAGLVSSEGAAAVPLGECVKSALQMTETLAAERRVTVIAEIDETLVVSGSRTALSEACLNIIENAVRYNAEGGSVSVSAKADSGRAILTVADTGIGLKRDELDRIFERFYRADAVRGTDGTGLGLSIVKAVVESHGGTITVESEPGRGSRFIIVLPIGRKTGTPAPDGKP